MKQRKALSTQIGFTLIEVLVVVLIISVLSGVMLGVINASGIRSKAQDAQRKADLKQIQTALELYFADNRRYPLSNGNGNGWEIISGGASMENELSPEYINNVPLDPILVTGNSGPCSNTPDVGPPARNRYNYRTDTDGSVYVLTAIMEIETSAEDSLCSGMTSFSNSCAPWSAYCYVVENP